MNDHDERMERVRVCLAGLACGDALGQQFFYFPEYIGSRTLPVGPWEWTDDTAMAVGIAEVLLRHGEVDPDELATVFARNYALEPHRGYGAGMHDLLDRIGRGASWREESPRLFGGSGSFGNGSAMRVGPVGAYSRRTSIVSSTRPGPRPR